MVNVTVEAASFRDPSGHVYMVGERIFRSVTDLAASDYEFVRKTQLLNRVIDEERTIPEMWIE